MYACGLFNYILTICGFLASKKIINSINQCFHAAKKLHATRDSTTHAISHKVEKQFLV